ncbi:MAG: SGNH/GDSL hydrolase family protein [Planctomycetota bacterium]|nr:SGNH/GDSL hydrolase family protein [Planctomycetota bacterium]
MSRPTDTRGDVSRVRLLSRRGIGLRAASVLVGLSPLILLEGVLCLAGLGQISTAEDPYIGFVDVQPLFVHNPHTDRFEIPRTRELFQPESFPATKGDRTSRVFCLGGSTVQGRPYGIATSFSTWLKLDLREASPDRDWEVVNCGGISYASYRLAPIMQELLGHDPDLFVIYAGHNEFLEDRTYRAVKETPIWVARAHRGLSRLRSYNVIRSWFVEDVRVAPRQASKDRSTLATEVEALLDYRGGLDAYKRDATWHAGVARHFEFNLRRMVHMAQNAGVPVVLMNPVANLKDSPPFKVVHRDDITEEDQGRFDSYRNAAGSLDQPAERRIESLRAASALDARHAGIHFELGKSLEVSGAHALAKKAFMRAKDEDICPLRMTEPLHLVLAQVASETSAHWLDVRALFEHLTEDGIPGNEWLVDHVHPSIRGHQRIAEALCRTMIQIGIVEARPGWESQMPDRYREHLDSLEPVYYVKGRQQLEGLRMWSQGRSSKVRRTDQAK